MFSENFNDLNFKEISGTSATKSKPMPRLNIVRNQGFRRESFMKLLLFSSMNGKDAINMAFAGVGKPIKFSDCRVSILNLASLNAEKTAIRNAE